MITTTEMVKEVSGGDLVNLYAGTPNVSVVIARPANHNDYQSVITDIHTGISIQNEPTEQTNATVAMESLVYAKLNAHKTTHIIVTQCENLQGSTLSRLALIAQSTNTKMILAYGIDSGQRTRDWGATFNAPDVDWRNIALPTPAPAIIREQEEIFPQDLPSNDFIMFRAACKSRLSEEEFKIVDKQYIKSFNHANSSVIEDPERIQELINTQLSKTYTPEQAITIIRATQVAYLLNGYLLKVDLSQLCSIINQRNALEFDEEDWTTLQQLPETEASALAAILHEGHTLQDCEQLNIFDKIELPNPKAQRIHRAHQMYAAIMNNEDALFKDQPVRWRKRIENTLRKSGLGLRTPDPIQRETNPRWQYKYGLLVQKVRT